MRVTASKIGDLMSCAYWARPGLDLLPNVSNPAAALGTEIHGHIEAFLMENRMPGPVSPEAQPYVDAWLEHWPKVRGEYVWLPEVKLAWDMATGECRILPSKGPRDYSAAKRTELVGTADVMSVAEDHVALGDWKTGRRENVTPTEDNAQVTFLSMVASRIHDRSRVEAFLDFVGPEEVERDPATFFEMDLLLFEQRLRERIASIPTSQPEPGNACKYCLHRHACPAVDRAVADVGGDSSALAVVSRAGPTDLIPPDRLLAAYKQTQVVEGQVRLVKDRIKAAVFAAGGEVSFDGRSLRIVDVKGKETLSAASITRALGKDDAKPLLQKLREVGAIEQGAAYSMLKEGASK